MKEEALKLADELSQYTINDGVDDLNKRTIAMIRRLVEELDKQEMETARVRIQFVSVADENNKLKNQLNKQGEPVVWWNGLNESEEDDFMYPKLRQAHIDHPQSCTHKFYPIPLYTAPQTKPLSDDEIWELHQEHIDEIPCGHSMKTVGFVEFARAIEERHGIK